MRLLTVVLVLLLALLATAPSCCDGARKQEGFTYSFRLSNGKTVECSQYSYTYCGYNLTDCQGDREYLCQINLERTR